MANFYGGSGNDTLNGTGSADSLFGGAGNDRLLGNGGNDTLIGGIGADYLSGGSGTDLADYSTSADGVTVNLATGGGTGGDAAGDTLTGIEYVTGSGFADTLIGNTLNNLLTGGAGDDFLDGGSGTDSLYGGDGNDSLRGGSGADILSGGAGIDTADYSTSTSGINASLQSGAGSSGDASGDSYSGIENLAGGSGADTLTGDANSNHLWGGGGSDQLFGGLGDDTLAGGTGADTLYGGEDMDFLDYSASGAGVSIDLSTGSASGGDAAGDRFAGMDGVIGSGFNDTLIGFDWQGTSGDIYTNVFYGAAGSDYIDARGANDSVYGGDDNDTVLGGDGADFVSGDAGNDQAYGGAGNDTVAGGSGDDLVDGGQGNDSLTGDDGRDTLYGGDGNDQLTGGDGNDQLFGGLGNDVLDAGNGNDSLYGGDGNDVLFGGAGNDLLQGGVGNDTIYAGLGDTIDGSENGDDIDVLDLTGLGPKKIIRDPLNPENGIVQFLDIWGNVTGTLTFTNIEQIIACFTPGTQIVTDRGEVAVERLVAGDRVQTRDNGLQTIRWVGRKRLGIGELLADPSLLPVRIRQGALGAGLPERDMLVSRQHRMLVTGARAELMFGTDEVLVRAAHLVGLPGIEIAAEVKEVTYLHILFDRHEIVLGDGAWSESFQPGDRSLKGMDDPSREEVLKLFPELAGQGGARFTAARLTLKAHEARVLMRA